MSRHSSSSGSPSAVRHGVEPHVVPDVAHEQQRAAGEHQLGPVGGGVGAVAVHRAGDRLPALGEARLQLPGHEAEPGAVAADLVRAVDGGDGVLQVDDRGDRRLEHDVRDLRRGAGGRPGWRRRRSSSACRPCRRSSTASGAPGSPRYPTSCAGSASPTAPSAVSRGQRSPVEAVGGDVGVRGPLQREVARRAAGRPPRSPARRAARRSRGRARGPAGARPCRRGRRTAIPSGRSRR